MNQYVMNLVIQARLEGEAIGREKALKEVGEVIGEFSDSKDWNMVCPFWQKRLEKLRRIHE